MGRLIGRLVKTESRSFLGALMDADNAKDQEHRMSDSTTPQDLGAMPPASAGSVAGGPLGWAVVNEDGTAVRFAGSFLTLANSATQDDEIVPLYRQQKPTLTDAEREALALAARRLSGEPMWWRDRSTVFTLRGLLERLG